MDKRQSIQDLQARLASRLAAKDQLGALASWLAVEAGGQRFLLPLGQSGELFLAAPLIRVPYVKKWYLGLVNLRGALYGVADLAGLPWGDLRSGHRPWAPTPHSRLIALPTDGDTLCALAVDRILGLKSAEKFQVSADQSDDELHFLLRKFQDEDGGIWREIDLGRLILWSEFLDIHERPVNAD